MNGRGERVRRGTSPEKPPARQATQIQPTKPPTSITKPMRASIAYPMSIMPATPSVANSTRPPAPGTGSGAETASRCRPAHQAKNAKASMLAQMRRTVLMNGSPRRATNTAPARISSPRNKNDRDRPERRPEVLEQGTVEPPVVRSR